MTRDANQPRTVAPGITSTTGVVGGRAVIAETRLEPIHVFREFKRGTSIDALRTHFCRSLTTEQVENALRYVMRRLAGEL